MKHSQYPITLVKALAPVPVITAYHNIVEDANEAEKDIRHKTGRRGVLQAEIHRALIMQGYPDELLSYFLNLRHYSFETERKLQRAAIDFGLSCGKYNLTSSVMTKGMSVVSIKVLEAPKF